MAGRIPQSFINDLLARVDIVDVIDARVKLKKAGKEYQALCPFHNEKTPSFTVSPDKQFYHCFGCGEHGTALTFLIEHDRMEFVEAVEALARQVGVEVPREETGRGRDRAAGRADDALYELLTRAARHFQQALKGSPEAVAYLKGRGLTGVVARDFGIGYAPDTWHGLSEGLPGAREEDLLAAGLLTTGDRGRPYDRFRGRIMFPIRDTRGRTIGFGGRVLGDGTPKYLNSPETALFHKGRELYGLYEARRALRRIDRLLVVEGYLDVVALAQAGIPNAVASLGTAATEEHFQKLYRYAAEVVCCFDGDAAGRQAAWRALEHALPVLSDGRQLKFMFLPEGEDPDSLVRAQGKDAFLTLAAGAVPAIEYLFRQLSEGLDLDNLDERAKLASLALPHIDRVPDGILKQLMADRLEALTGYASQPAPRRADAGRRPAAPATLPALARRLVGYLLQRPALARTLPAEVVAALDAAGAGDVLVDLIKYVDKHPDAEADELIGRWSGQPVHGELTRLAARPASLGADALEAEFADGVSRYLERTEAAARRQLLADMKQDPSEEKFLRFWSLRRGSGEDAGN